MDPIFLTPDTTFEVSIKTNYSQHGAPMFDITDGGPYKIRTATGREYARIQQAIGRQDADAYYALLPEFLTEGIDKKVMNSIHPDAVRSILVEVLKRSRVSEADAGK